MTDLQNKQTDAALNEILEQDIGAIRAAQKTEFDFSQLPQTLILFGAGALGQHTAKSLANLPHRFQLLFCDNNQASAKVIAGIPVLSPAEAFKTYRETAVFVVTVYNSSPLYSQLKNAGCRHVISVPTLFRAFPDQLLPFFGLAAPDPIFKEQDAVRAAYDLWDDDESRQEYIRLLRWHVSGKYQNLFRPHPAAETYFPHDLFSPIPRERFVDCGAFDGDVLRVFLERWKNEFEVIAAFEPDPISYQKLGAYLAQLPSSISNRITIHPFALGAQAGKIRFAAQGSVASSVTDLGETVIESVCLDETLGDFHPTFIKMDIEGSERDALAGAKNLLQNDAPVLAICLYHDIAHLWQIPLQIHAENPAYRLYLRRYAEDCWETVCYAVPLGR